jgi:tetratricopeptide (TPR) repeat protein
MILLNPDNRMEKSPLANKAIYEIGGNYQAIAVYDQAANWYEKYAELKPTPDKADVALSDAVQLRLGLGQAEEAIKDATFFRAKFGATKPTETAAIQFAIGAHYAGIEAWDQAKVALQGAMGLIDRSAIDIQLQAHATLARAYTHQRDGLAGATSEYAKVRALWSNPEAAVAKLAKDYPAEDEGARNRRLAKGLNAVGEAYFFAAEDHRRAEVETIRFPEYHGNGKKEDVLKHVNGKVAEWMKKKAAAIVKVEAEYKKIVDLQPEPPPRWVIAAGSRVGLLWGGFVDDFRRAPYPKDWDKKGCAVACGTADELSWREIKENYFANLDGASQPFKDGTTFNGQRVGAKPALVTCLNYSLKFQYFDQFSRDCEVWLAKNYKAEYHVVDELRGAPTLSNNGADDDIPPLLANGQLYEPPPVAAPAPAAAAPAAKSAP